MAIARSFPFIPTRVLAAACVLTAAAGAAGCGSSTHSPQVASLSPAGHSSTAGGHATTGPANEGIPDPDGRPRETLDMTAHQLTALQAPFGACITRHHPFPKNNGYVRRFRKAVEACVNDEPLPPWQLDPANPQARAFIGRTVSCMRAKGYHAEASLFSSSYFGNRTWIVKFAPSSVQYQLQTEKAEDACHRQALTS